MTNRNVLFGLGLETGVGEVNALLAHTTQADRDGLDLVALSDHPYFADRLDAYATLGFVLGRTMNITGAVNVTNLPSRPAPPRPDAGPDDHRTANSPSKVDHADPVATAEQRMRRSCDWPCRDVGSGLYTRPTQQPDTPGIPLRRRQAVEGHAFPVAGQDPTNLDDFAKAKHVVPSRTEQLRAKAVGSALIPHDRHAPTSTPRHSAIRGGAKAAKARATDATSRCRRPSTVHRVPLPDTRHDKMTSYVRPPAGIVIQFRQSGRAPEPG